LAIRLVASLIVKPVAVESVDDADDVVACVLKDVVPLKRRRRVAIPRDVLVDVVSPR
jgi:hypothetical protein